MNKGEETRTRILEAALVMFSDHGFNAAATREIAALAGVNQGLITYHFKSKDILWREVANKIFSEARQNMANVMFADSTTDPKTRQRNLIKAYVRFTAARPELFRFMVEEGKHPSQRSQWLVDTHLKPIYQGFLSIFADSADLAPHRFYAMLGAGSLLFALGPVCDKLTGLNPYANDTIEAHANFVADLLVP